MRILSFNASTADLHACLADENRIVAKQIIICKADNDKIPGKNAVSKQFAASLIIPTVASLLNEVNWSKSSIDAIVVGVGPGSFTGIRVAVVTARTLAQALEIPLLGISEFECYAFKEQNKEFPVAIALNAGKKQYYCAHLSGSSDLSNQSNDKINKAQVNWDMTTHHISEEDFKGHLDGFKHVIMLPESVSPDSAQPYNQAATQANLAYYRLEQILPTSGQLNKIFPYQFVKPLYVRNASITIKALNKANQS